MKSLRHAVILLAFIASMGAPSTLSGDQIPEKFKNLKILPTNSSRPDVVRVMRGFAGALGVRCNHCHVGENPANLDNYDFASDEKEPKRVARAMMRMTQEINEKLIPAAGISEPMQVQCVTCHRGIAKPEQLIDVLTKAVDRGGVPGALEQYRDLRSRYYGRAAYDFGAPTLNMLAEWLNVQRKDVAAAIDVQEFNVKVNPDIATSYSLLGDLYLAKGDRAAARASFERALALDPSSDFFKKRVEELKK